MTKWRKMNSAPRDGTPILVGKWVLYTLEPKRLCWEQYVASYKEDPLQDSSLCPWDDFDAWTVIPKPPHWGKE